MNRPNLLLITADDMNWDSVGCYGYPVERITPNIDSLARDGIRFDHGHVTIAVCQPSRSAMMTGRYPHRSGGEGFHTLRHEGIPILPELLRAGGYTVGILGKVGHSTPYEDFTWDMTFDMAELGQGRSPEEYYRHAASFMGDAVKADRPFFLMANSHDPHRPFYGNDKEAWYRAGKNPAAAVPSRTYTPDEITVPGFLPELDEVRLEIAEYCSSIRRCDDTVGRILEALEESGAADNTLILFLSDNGMAFPFAKTNCYLHSTKTPWLMRWPDQIKAGSIDSEHFVSGIDILPTFLDAAGIPAPEGVDGASFLPVLEGESQAGRELVFTQFHQTAGKRSYPMRCVQNARFGYIYNPWSNGERIFHNESQAGRTFEAMKKAAEQDGAVADRVELFLHRVPEELYNFGNDPHALTNLIEEPGASEELKHLQEALEAWMVETKDPALDSFRNRHDPAAREQAVQDSIAVLGGE
jgi:N-sulfoglucosamine sulfohydrolase